MLETCSTCQQKEHSAATRRANKSEKENREQQRLQSRLCRIKHKIIVLSGKGGVGKSMVAVNLAISLARSGKRVGVLDVDIHGPSIPTMLGLENEKLHGDGNDLLPISYGNLMVMSIGFVLNNHDEALIWRGPRKIAAIKQFLADVAWGDLDCLVVDSPPGTGDEVLSVCQLIDNLDGAILVTTPQKIAAIDVRKTVTFCRRLQVPILGVVENMNGFVCPKCGEITSILPEGEGRKIAQDMEIPFLGSIPIDPDIAWAGDRGSPFLEQFADSRTAEIMNRVVAPLLSLISAKGPNRSKRLAVESASSV